MKGGIPMFACVIGEGRYSNVCLCHRWREVGEGRYSSVYLCHRWREVFQCLPMSEVKGGIPMFAYVIGEGRCSSVCLCIGGRRAGGDKMRKLCVGMCCFFFLFFFFFFFFSMQSSWMKWSFYIFLYWIFFGVLSCCTTRQYSKHILS